MASSHKQPPGNFIFHPSLSKFNVSFEDLLAILNASSSLSALDGVATGAIIFKTCHDDPQPRILLVQRSSTDSMPNRWEIPGGAVDPGETVLAGVVREVFEETGLAVKNIKGPVEHDDGDRLEGFQGGYLFHTRRGSRIVKFTFVVEVEDPDTVRLDPEEHQDCVWATEEECRVKRAARTDAQGPGKDAVDLAITTRAQEAAIMKAFSEL